MSKKNPTPRPIRAVGIVLKKKRLLVLWRKHKKQEYYVFPGGGVEKRETIKQAVARELFEEASVKIKVKKLLYHLTYILKDGTKNNHYFCECKFLSGRLRLGDFNEKAAHLRGDLHKPLWVSLTKIPQLKLYPLTVRDWLIADAKNHFRLTPKKATIIDKRVVKTS